MAEKPKPSLPKASTSVPVKDIPRGLIGRRGDLLNPTARLPSLKSPRDLTLGGAQKKSFKPTIPVRRERTKEEDSSTSRTSSPKPSKRARSSERGKERGRGRGRERNVIQSHTSIFEEGPSGERMVRRSHTEGYGRLTASEKGDFTASSSLAKTFKNLSMKREERDAEDSKKIAELLRDDFLQDMNVFADEHNCPVKLPLKFVEMKSKKETNETKVQVKQEPGESPKPQKARIRIKQEPVDSDDEDMPSTSMTLEDRPKSQTQAKDDKSSEDKLPLFSRRQEMEGQLLFLQLPDSLPGLPPSEDEDKAVVRQQIAAAASESNQSKSQGNEKRTECALQDLPEGFLGKLQILKSGKMRLRLGTVSLDVATGAQCNFLQDVVSVRLDTEQKRMINLGQIKERVVCSPNLETLLAGPT